MKINQFSTAHLKRVSMKWRFIQRFLLLSFLFICLSETFWAQTTYYSQGSALDPATLASWNTVRTGGGATPPNFTSGDIFVVQGTGGGMGAPHLMNVPTAWTITPAATTGKIVIESGASLTLTANNVTAPAIQVDGNLNINAGRTFSLSNGSTVPDLLVNAGGIVNVAATGTFTMSAGITGTISGTLTNAGTFTPVGLTFNASGIYNHNQNGGTVPTATWSVGSSCNINGVTGTAPAGINQAFSNFNWNCLGQSSNITATGLATINGNFNITSTNGYSLILPANLTMAAASTLIVGAGTILDAQTFSINNVGNVDVNGTIKTANTNGLYGAAACTFNVPTISLNVGSTINYNANGAQTITGTATLGSNYSNLTTSTSGVKTLGNDVTVGDNLKIDAGTSLQPTNHNLTATGGTTTILGTLADNSNAGTTNLGDVIIQAGGAISHTVVDDVNITGNLTVSGAGTSTIGPANIVVSGSTTINAGATLFNQAGGTFGYNGGIINNGTWSTSGNPNITVAGGLTNNGTMSATGTGTYTFNATQTIGGSQPIIFQGPVNVAAGFTVTNNNASAVTIQGQLTGGGGATTFINNTTLKYEDPTAPTITNLTNAAGSNFYYSGANQNLRSSITYSNLYIAGTGTKTAPGALTVQQNLDIASGTTLYDGGFPVTVNGNVNNNGSATTTGAAGGVSVTGAGVHSISGTGSFQKLTIATAGNTTSMLNSFSVDALDVTAGTLNVGNNTLTINTSLAGANLTASCAAGSSITLNGTAAINLPVAISSLNNFTLNNTVGSTLNGPLDVCGTLTLTRGALTFTGVNTLTVHSSPVVTGGYLTGGTNSVLLTTGSTAINLVSNLVQAGSTIDLNIQSTGGVTSSIPSANDITIAGGSSFTLNSDIGVSGNLTNGGTFTGTGRKVTFNHVGAGNQTITGGTNNFGGVTISTSNQVVLATNINVAGDWILNSGSLSGNFRVTFNGVGAQNIGGPLSTSFYNLTTSNTNLSISNNEAITNNLTFASTGKITLGTSDLTIAGSITAPTANRFIVTNSTGRLVRSGAIAAGFVFPVGSSSASGDYAPVTFTVAGSSNVGVCAVGTVHPNQCSATNYLNRYWTLSTLVGGTLAANNYTFAYSSGLVGTPQGAFYYGGAWTAGVNPVNPSPFTIALPALAASDKIDVSSIDNTLPTVTTVTPNLNPITAANVGADMFTITVVFNKSMSTGASPTITLTSIPNSNTTLAWTHGVWSTSVVSNDTYTAYYTVSNSGLVINPVNIAVTNGIDACGNVQVAASPASTFVINMGAPNVTSIVPNLATIADANVGTSMFTLVITYDRVMNNTIQPVITFPTVGENPNTDGTLSYNSGSSSWDVTNRIFTARFNVSDQGLCMSNIDVQVANAQDAMGNIQNVYSPPILGSMNLFNVSMSNPVDAGPNVATCNSSTTFSATSPGAYTSRYWTCNQAGVTYSNSTSPTATANNLALGANIFTWTVIAKGCTVSDQVTITNNQVTVSNAGADQTLCGNNFTLAGNTPASGSGIWTVISGALPAIIVTPSQANTTLINVPRATTGPVVLRWTITRGACSSFDDVNISNVSVAAVTGPSKSVCTDAADYFLDGNNPTGQTLPGYVATGKWTSPSVPPAIITNTAQYNSTISNLLPDNNIFTWTVSNSLCSSSATYTVVNNVPQETPDAGPNQTLCDDKTSLIGSNPSVGSGISPRWVLIDGAGTFANNTLYNTQVTGLDYYVGMAGPGYWQQVRTINRFRWVYNKNGCEIWDEVGVINAMPRPANAGPDQQVCWDEANLNALDLGSGSMEHYWTQGDGCAALPSNSATITGPNEFNAHVSNIQSGTTAFRWHKWVRINCSGQASDCLPPILCNAGRPNATEAGFPAAQCHLEDDMQINRVGGQIGRAQAGTNQINCADTALLNASSPGTVFNLGLGHIITSQWTVVQGTGSFDNPSAFNTTVRGLMPSDNANYHNILRWTVTNQTLGCIATSDVIVSNGLPSNPAVGPVMDVCVPTALVSATPPTSGSGTWSVRDGTGVLSNSSCNAWSCNVTVTGIGQNNTLRWTIHKNTTITDPFDVSGNFTNAPAGCELWQEVTFHNNGITSEAGTPDTVCNTFTSMAAADPAGNGGRGIWTTAGTGIFTTPTLFNTVVTNLNSDLNTLNWTVTKGSCVSSDQVQIYNFRPDNPVPSVPTPDICSTTTTLNAIPPAFGLGTGHWSVVSGSAIIGNSLATSATATGLGLGPNVFRWTITKDICSRSADVTVNNNSVVADAGTNVPILCGTETGGYSTQLDAVAPDAVKGWTGLWTVSLGPANIATPTLYNTMISYPGGTNLTGLKRFTWTISGPNGANPKCTASDVVDINVFVPTRSNAGSDAEVCFDQTGSLALNANVPSYGTGLWSWTGTGALVPTINTPTLNTSTVTNLGLNETILRWTITNNTCASSDDMTITRNYVFANAGADQDICGDTYTLGANNPVDFGQSSYGWASGTWSKVNATGTFANSTIYNTTITGLRASPTPDNTLRWTVTKGGCSAFDEVVITNNQIASSAGPNQHICSSLSTLAGNNVGIIGGSGKWTWSNAAVVSNTTAFNSPVSNLQSGLNSFTWTVTSALGGCTDNKTVQIYNESVVAGAGFDVETCNASSPLLADAITKPLATGAWTRFAGNPVIFASSASNITTVSGLTSGSYTLRWTVTYTDAFITCTASDDMVLLNSSTQTSTASTPDNETCGEDGQLLGTIPNYLVGESGKWTGGQVGSTIVNSTANSTTVKNMPIGANTFTWTISRGNSITCTSASSVTITNDYVTANAGPDQDLCTTSTNLAATAPIQGSGIWTKFGINPAVIADNTLRTTGITNLADNASHGFRWTVTQGGCSASDDVYINNNRVVANAGLDQSTCANSINLDGNNVSLLGATGNWTLVIPGTAIIVTPSKYNTLVNTLASGLNIFRWTVTSPKGCVTTDDVGMTYNYITANAGLQQETCNSSVTMAAGNPSPGTGTWTQISGNPAAIVTPTLAATTITGLTSGNYTFRWTVLYNGCTATSDVNIINSSPQTSMANTPAPQVCSNTGTLVGNVLLAGEKGLWTMPSGSGTIANATLNNTTVSNLGLGSNTFQWTITKGTNVTCTSSAQVTITNNTVSANAGPDQDICVTTTNLAATAPTQGTGVWTKFGINPAIIADNTLRTTGITNLSDNTSHGFTWTVSLGTCTASDDVYINNNRVVANAGIDAPTCSNSINLDGNNVSALGATGNWTLVTPGTASIVTPSKYNTLVNTLGSGLNIFRWTVTSAKGCVSIDDVGITYNYISSNAGLQQETCNSSVAMAAGDPSPGTGTWTQVSGNTAVITNSILATTTITGLTSGNYTFRWTVLYNGCSATSDVIIVNSSPQTAMANTPAPQVCINTGTLVGSALLPGEKGVWTIPSGSGTIANLTLNNTTVSSLGLGNNTFQWTITKGTNVTCTSSAQVTITNNTVSANAGPDQDLCVTTTNLAATAPTQGSGIWTKFGINPAIIADNTLRTTGITNLSDNTSHGFTWTVSLGTCTVSDDVYINNNRVVANAGLDVPTCSSSINLDGNNVSALGATGNWTLVTPGTASIVTPSKYNTLVNTLGSGLNIFRWTVTSAKGCVSTDDVGITYNYISSNAGLQQETCNSSVTMAAGDPSPGTGTWTQVSGNPAIITNSILATTTITGLTSGNYTFRWTVLYNGCSATSDVIIVDSSPQTAMANTPAPQVCSNTGTLVGSALLPGETGVWTIPSGSGTIVNLTLNNTTVSNLGLGNSTFQWTITKGTNVTCTSSAQVTITNNAVSANAGPDQDICTSSTNLAANAPLQGIGVWSKFGVNPAVIADNTLRTTGITNLLDNTSHGFTWTVSLGTCTASDDVYINNNRVLANAGLDQPTCSSSINLDGNNISALGATGNWTLVTPGTASIVTPSKYNTLVNTLGSGLNIFRWTVTSAKGCVSTDDVGITYNYIAANAGLQQETCSASVTLGAGDPTPGTGSWTQVSGNPASITNVTLMNTTVTGLTSGNYTFRWSVLYNGCTSTSDVIITNSTPQTAMANTPTPQVCNGSGTLVGNAVLPGETGLWTLVSGTGSISNPTLNNTSVNTLGNGSNSFTWTISKGITTTCQSSASVTIINNHVTASAFTSNNVSCDGTASLSANDPSSQSATGLWTVSTTAVISNPTNYTITATNLAQGNNIFTWTVTRGVCSANSSLTIANNKVVATVGGNLNICSGSTNLNAFDPSPNSGLWTLVSAFNPASVVITDRSLYNTSVSGISKTATFNWRVYNATCVDSSAYVIVSNNSVITSLPSSQTVCSSSTNLIASALSLGETGLWTSAGPNPIIAIPTTNNTNVTNLVSGTNTFLWTITNSSGCIGSNRYDVINDLPSQPNAGPDQNICGSSSTLNGNVPTYGTGVWKQIGGSPLTVISSPSTSSTGVSNLGAGATTFVWLITNNACSLADSMIINNNLFTVATGIDKSVCVDNSSLSVVQGFPGIWTKISGSAIIADPTNSSTVVTNLSFGENKFQWTVIGACTVSDQMSIFNNSPETPITEADKSVCQSTVTIAANTPTYGSGIWSNPGGGTAVITDVSASNTTVSNLMDGANTLRWTITYVGCSKSDDLIITSHAATALAGNDVSLCSNTTSLNAILPPVGTGSWSVISGGATIVNTLATNSVVNNLGQGANIFRWTVNNVTCSSFDDVTITNNSPDVANAGADIPTCNATVNLNGNNPTVGTGLWTSSTSAIISNPTLYNTSVTIPTGPTVFRWTITNNGCASFDEVTVSNNSITVNVGPDDLTCTGSYNLLGTNPALIGSGTGTGQWTIVGGSGLITNSLAYNSTVTNLLSTGTRESVFRWTVTDGLCSALDDIKIVNDQVTATTTGFMTCNSSASILANDPGLQNASGVWSVDNQTTQIITSTTSFTTTIKGLVANAINRARWTVTRNTCSATDTANIEYFVPNANITIPDIVHGCADTIQLIADPNLGGGTGLWSLKFGSLQVTLDNASNATTTARKLEIGNNVFLWTVANRGCTNSDEVSINNSSPVNTAGSDQAACTSNFTMNAQAPSITGSGLWTLVSGTVAIDNPTSPTTTVVASPGSNILQWIITDQGCSSSKQFKVTNNKPSPNAGTDVNVCENRVQLSGNSLKVGETGMWTIDASAGSEIFSSSSVNNPIVTNLRQGKVSFRWTVSNAFCSDYDIVDVYNFTPTINAGIDRTICENFVTLSAENPYTADNQYSSGVWSIGSSTVNISNPTFYNTTVTNLGQGSNLFTWTVSNGKCTTSDEVSITSNAIDVVAGLPYSEGCATTLNLEATQPPPGATGLWTAVDGGGPFDNASAYATTVRGLKPYNKLRWTITAGSCSFSNEIVYVSLAPSQAKTGNDTAICTNSQQITAAPEKAGESGLWTKVIGPSSINITSPASFQTMVTGLGLGSNVFKWTISNSQCSTSDLITITNNQVFANAGLDQSNICSTSASLSANVLTGTGVWTTSSSGVIIASSTSPNTNVSNLQFGNNSFSWTVTNAGGCSATDEVILKNNLTANLDAGNTQNICSGNANLAATNPGDGTGLWTLVGGAGTFANNTANQTAVSGLSVGDNIFKWTVTVAGCAASDQVTIRNNSIYVSAGTDQTLCNTANLTLNGTQPGAGITGIWSVNGGTGTFSNPSIFNAVVSNFTKGTNTYVWTLTDGACTNSSNITVTVNTPDSAKVGGPQFICTDNTIINAEAVANGVGTWSVQSGSATIVNPASNNTTVTGINTGLNTFRWTVNKNGCTLFADINVTNNAVSSYIANKEVAICTPLHTATIIGNNLKAGESGVWTKNPIDAGVINNPSNNVTTVTGLAYGNTIFRWTVSNSSCSSFDDVKVIDNYYNLTSAAPAGPATVCVDNTPILGSMWPSGASGLWTSTAPDVTFDNNTSVSTVARHLPGGTSSITWTITKDGCASPASFNMVNNAIYISAGQNQTVCSTSTIMNAQTLMTGETGVWTVNTAASITSINSPTTTVTGLITGDNTFTWTVTSLAGCVVASNIIVSNNAFTVTAGSNQISCSANYLLRGSDPLTGKGQWTINSGTGIFANATNFETTVSGMAIGANTFTWTVNRNGCTAANNVTITNDSIPAVVGSNFSVCTNNTTVSAQPIPPTSGATGLWTAMTGGGVFANPALNSTQVSGLSPGANRLRWTVTKGACVNYSELVVTNNIITASAGIGQTTCDDFTSLTATPLSPTAKGLWTGGGVTTVIVNPTSASTAVTGLQPRTNTFAWTVTDKGCTGTSTVQIISNHFNANAGADQQVKVSNANMTAQLPDIAATGSWSISVGNGSFVNPTNALTNVSGLNPGINRFTWAVTWNTCTSTDDVEITYNAIIANAGRDTAICSDTYTLMANDPFPGTGRWDLVSGNATIVSRNNQVTQVTGIMPGKINTFRWTVSINGFSVFDEVTIINKEFFLSAGDTQHLCANNTVMAADPPGAGVGSWRVIQGAGSFTNAASQNTAITNVGEGWNQYEWTVAKTGGCTESDTAYVFYDLPPTAAFTVTPTTGCSPVHVSFNNLSTGATHYYWYFGDNFSRAVKPPDTTYTATPASDQVYPITLIAYDASGCTDTVTHQVTAFKIPKVDFAVLGTPAYYPDATMNFENYSGDTYTNYYWNFGDGQTKLDLTFDGEFRHTYQTWGTYVVSLTVSSDNCSDTARKTIEIWAPIPKNYGSTRGTGCAPYTQNFTAGVKYATDYNWYFGDGGTSNLENPVYIYDKPGTYFPKLYAKGPGSDSTFIYMRTDTITVYPTPVADFEFHPDTVMLPNEPVKCYDRSTNAANWQWDFGTGNASGIILGQQSPEFRYTKPGSYLIKLKVWGEYKTCYDTTTATIPIIVEPAGVCKFPNAFSPNQHGRSDGRWVPGDYSNNYIFHPIYRGVDKYKLEIFDRWGAKIFESNDPGVGWNGYIGRKKAVQDVYVWKVTGMYKNGTPFQDAGDVTLMK